MTAFSVKPGKFVKRGKVAYKLSEASTTKFRVARKTEGRKAGKRCVKTTRKNRKAKRCTRLVMLKGSFAGPGNAGDNSFRFTGRLGKKKLKPGKYLLIGTPVDASGNKGKAVRAPFRVVRKR